MTNFLPHDIIPGTGADADQVQENFEAIENKFPVQASDVYEVLASDITWDIPPPPLQGGSLTPKVPIPINVLAADPTLAQALGLTSPTLCVANAPGPGPSDFDIGPLSPCRLGGATGVLWCSAATGVVGFVAPVTSADLTDSSFTETTWQLDAASEPYQAFKSSSSIIYVICKNGGSPCISKINTSDNTVTDAWVDLSTVGGTTMVDVGRGVFTRQGYFLVLIGQASGEPGFKRIIRVDLSAASAIEFASHTEGAYSGFENITSLLSCHNATTQLSSLIYLYSRVEDGVTTRSGAAAVNAIDSADLGGADFAAGGSRHAWFYGSATVRFRALAPVGPSRCIMIGDEYPAYATGGSAIRMNRTDRFDQTMSNSLAVAPEMVDVNLPNTWVLVPDYGPGSFADLPLPGNMVWTGKRVFWLSKKAGLEELVLCSYGYGGGWSFESTVAYTLTVPTTLNLDKCSLTFDGQNLWVGHSQTDLGVISCITAW